MAHRGRGTVHQHRDLSGPPMTIASIFHPNKARSCVYGRAASSTGTPKKLNWEMAKILTNYLDVTIGMAIATGGRPAGR